MSKYYIISYLLLLCIIANANAQNNILTSNECKIMFYNVENLFDIVNDSIKNDDEFTPDGVRGWEQRRYNDKLNKISKVIIAASEWQLPAIIGLAEVENYLVLDNLIKHTVLKNENYNIIHKESPDLRGIDVALLYKKDLFEPIGYKTFPVSFEGENARPTRDILYVKGRLLKKHRVHLFVNHWPSRYGGEVQTISKRNAAAALLKEMVDSICKFEPNARIIICGDFNDTPSDESIAHVLGAKQRGDSVKSRLINLSTINNSEVLGTIKHQGNWSILDQFIVTSALLDGDIYVPNDGFKIIAPPFLLEEDKDASGQCPRRTYIGMKYYGGFSDHLPIILQLKTK